MAREKRRDADLSPVVKDSPWPVPTDDFDALFAMIEQARERAFQAVNRELISLYWNIG